MGRALYDDPSDAELLRSARDGDVAAVGALLERHGAGMRAVALSLLGNLPDAEDAVQDASLIAFRHVGDVRQPESVSAWLRMIVRNVCRSRLRSTPPATPVPDLSLLAAETDPEKVVDRHAMRDWIWQSVNELSPTLRMAVMLRHFSPRTPSYDQMAALCGVPVGTVRSRLAEARRKLVGAMAVTADSVHADSVAAARESARDAVETLAAAEQGRFAELTAQRWTPDAAYYAGRQRVGDRDFLVRGMAGDLEAGVRQRFVSAVTSRDTTIWEMDMINPPDAPHHCPPAVAWLMTMEDGRMNQLRLFHAAGVRGGGTPHAKM
ncbi:RNA polymerase sigma factor [Streptomyces sulfonofaciens]|uniref:RNA polymerase sigma factor n=1 Tax=Streptomyces sulfonofaciens TaxID=68272 RepID=UPI001E3B95C7|nr:sigma-70 family RNA polymerase sigma factor [Streptomyces sulfonofaciens]